MKNKLQIKVTVDQLAGIIHYVDSTLQRHLPDPDDVDMTLRIKLLNSLHHRLSKRETEALGNRCKITVPDTEALALLAQWTGDRGGIPAHTDISVRKITDVPCRTWA